MIWQKVVIFALSLLCLSSPLLAADQPSINVVLITIDSLRPDHLSAYGHGRPTTPTLDRLARRGTRFTQVINQASWTSSSLVSVLTSLYPSTHGVDGRGKTVGAGVITPLKRLRETGYQVPSLSYLTALPEFDYLGFEAVAADEREVGRWLDRYGHRPFFIWLHLEGPHLPYNPPSPYDRMFTQTGSPIPQVVRERLKPFLGDPVIPKGEVTLSRADLDALVALYDGKIRKTDDEVQGLLDLLERRRLLTRTIVVVTADHGDELFDHGWVGHASTSLSGTLYDELIRVPLIMAGPGIPRGRVVQTQVEGVDLMPTLLDLLKVSHPPSLQGGSLLPLLRGRSGRSSAAFAETTVCGRSCPEAQAQDRLQAIRRPPWKLIRRLKTTGAEQVELFHLASDRHEQRNVAAGHPGIVSRLVAELNQWVAKRYLQGEELRGLSQLAVRENHRGGAEAPRVLRPQDGRRLTFAQEGGRVVLEWEGASDEAYLLEYDLGSGKFHTNGSFLVQGTQKEFGPLKPEVWELLTRYNPFRFRLRSAHCKEANCWTPWVAFQVTRS
jgi:arylsulfatase A-like enzyme